MHTFGVPALYHVVILGRVKREFLFVLRPNEVASRLTVETPRVVVAVASAPAPPFVGAKCNVTHVAMEACVSGATKSTCGSTARCSHSTVVARELGRHPAAVHGRAS